MRGGLPDPWRGRTLDGRYEILERVGVGGMGSVYRARQTSVDRIVAVKMLRSEAARENEWVQRFYNEAKACSRLQHPNTIRMFDFGQTESGSLYMVMEFLDGRSLREVVHDEAPLAADRVARLLVQCCASLAEAHRAGIIHRDIKSDNLFLLDLPGSPDHVKVLDFSVAKLLEESVARTAAGLVFGTPQYMSPEQASGEPLDPRTDLYSLGVLGYELLSGRLPFDHENPMVVLEMLKTDPLPPFPATVPARLAQVLGRCLEKDPARRPASATQLAAELEDVRAGLRQGPRATPRPSTTQRTLQGASGATPARPTVSPAATLQDASPPSGMQRTQRDAEPPGAGRTLRDAEPPAPGRAPGAPEPAAAGTRDPAPAPAPAAARPPPPGPDTTRRRPAPAPDGGVLFWLLCLVAAAAIAVLSYATVSRLAG